jgi:hypothetical protein
MLPVSRARSSLRTVLVREASGRMFAAYWGSLVLVDLTREVPALAVGTVAVLVAALSTHQAYVARLGVAVTGWLFLTGFVSHTGGDLRGLGTTDLLVLALLVAVATGAPRGRRER